MTETEKAIAEVWAMFKETDRKFQETDRKFQETREQMKETDKKLDKLIGKWGSFVEGFVAPGILKVFQKRGIAVSRTYRNVEVKGRMEIDILAVDREYVIAVEVKTILKQADIEEHLERLSKFRDCFPEYSDKKLLGALAAIEVPDNTLRSAYQKGLFVIVQSGEDTIKILNDKKFQPREW